VNQLNADDLDAEHVQRRLRLVLDLLPQVLADLQTFERWLVELAERAAGFSRRRQHRVERSRSFEAFGWCRLPILLRVWPQACWPRARFSPFSAFSTA
jgi:hypothetical protein